MIVQYLIVTARTLVAGGTGLLAMNESNSTCNKRFPVSRRKPLRFGDIKSDGAELEFLLGPLIVKCEAPDAMAPNF